MGGAGTIADRDPLRWSGFRLVPALLAARARMVVNAALRSGRERRGWTVLLVVGGLAVMAAGYRIAGAALAVSDPDPRDVEPIAAGLSGMVGGFTLVTSVTFALGALYFARDLEAMLVSPLPARSIVLTKMSVQLATGLGIGTLLAAPPLLAYLERHGAVLALPWIGLCVLAMAAIPLVAATAATVLAVRLLPARRVRELGGLVVVAAVFGTTAVNLTLRGPDGFTRTPGLLDPARQGGPADAVWLPTGWAARAIAAALRHDAATSLAWGLPLVVGAAALLVLAARALERPFVVGFARSLEAGKGRHRRKRGPAVAGTGRRPAWLVIARKDLRETLRDASQLGQLVLPLALFAVYIASPSSVGAARGADLPAWFATLLTAGFASLFAASGVGLRGVGLEGSRMWVLRVAPIDTRAVLAAKFAAGLSVASVLGLGLLAVGIVKIHLGPIEALGVAIRLVVVVAGLVGLAVGMGAVRPRLDWSDPRRSVGIGTSLVFLAVGSAYLGIAFVIMALPYSTSGGAAAIAVAGSDAGIAALAALVAGVPLAVGTAKLRAREL